MQGMQSHGSAVNGRDTEIPRRPSNGSQRALITIVLVTFVSRRRVLVTFVSRRRVFVVAGIALLVVATGVAYIAVALISAFA